MIGRRRRPVQARNIARAVGVALIMIMLCTGCGGGGHRSTRHAPRSTPPVTAIRVDDWTPPHLAGPPSTTKFCTLLVAGFAHLQTNAIATTAKVRGQIIGDFVRFAPTIVAAAPPGIAVAANTYLSGLGKVLGTLDQVGLNAAKAPAGALGNVLYNAGFRAAQAAVLGYSQSTCHQDLQDVG